MGGGGGWPAADKVQKALMHPLRSLEVPSCLKLLKSPPRPPPLAAAPQLTEKDS